MLVPLMNVIRFAGVTLALSVLIPAAISLSSQPRGKLKASPTLAVSDPGAWKSLEKGVDFRKIALERSEPSHSIDPEYNL